MREYKLITFSAACAFLFCSGVLTNNQQMYWMATTLLLIIGGCFLLAWFGLKGLTAKRSLHSEVWEKEPAQIHLRLSYQAHLMRGSLFVRDHFPETFFQADKNDMIPVLRQATDLAVQYTVIPQQRGLHRIGPLEMISTDPIGLFYSMRQMPLMDEIVVYPQPMPIAGWDWAGGGGYRFQVSASQARRGDGTEWHGTREYAAGDPLRRVDWRATARRNEWHVREFEASFLSELTIVLDLYLPIGSATMEQAFERQVRRATWLSLQCLQQGIPLRLIGSGWEGLEVRQNTPKMRTQLLRALATVQPKSQEPLAKLLPSLLKKYGRNSTLCLMLNSSEPNLTKNVESYIKQGYNLRIVRNTE
jgi:uncharacterized protein (DUF58 family)